ncbi:hypothetical protein [Thioalkalivibrio sp. XN8]|uniref:hypothetical protein n=1 Tax=Thioalkalivibrio sp. XN8 TaxID=2712863 RepID=UPI00197F03EB|nr:hypothetical protein [Thioalkalivibrio sp. XN8]
MKADLRFPDLDRAEEQRLLVFLDVPRVDVSLGFVVPLGVRSGMAVRLFGAVFRDFVLVAVRSIEAVAFSRLQWREKQIEYPCEPRNEEHGQQPRQFFTPRSLAGAEYHKNRGQPHQDYDE